VKVIALELVAITLHHVVNMARIRSVLVINVGNPGETGNNCGPNLLEIEESRGILLRRLTFVFFFERHIIRSLRFGSSDSTERPDFD